MREFTPYTGFLVLLTAAAAVATLVGFGGLYVVLTGGTVEDPADVAVLGDYACDSPAGDPAVSHEASYDIERTVRDGTEIDSVEVSETAAGIVLEFRMRGELLDASAGGPEGTAIPLVTHEDDDIVRIERTDASPFRVWIDTVTEAATVTRTNVDICPPTDAFSADPPG